MDDTSTTDSSIFCQLHHVGIKWTYIYTMSQKKSATFTFAITSAKVDQFSYFFTVKLRKNLRRKFKLKLTITPTLWIHCVNYIWTLQLPHPLSSSCRPIWNLLSIIFVALACRARYCLTIFVCLSVRHVVLLFHKSSLLMHLLIGTSS